MKKLSLFGVILMLFAVTVMAQEATITQLLDNEYVAVFDYVCKPGTKHEVSDNRALMAYVIEGGTVKAICPEDCVQCKQGKCCQTGKEMKTGTAFFVPAGKYGMENIGQTTIHALLVEFKKDHTCGKECTDCTEQGCADCKGCDKKATLLLDNCCVRVIKDSIKPGASKSCPAKGLHISYTLTAGKAEITGADGKVISKEFNAGAVKWCDNCNGISVKNAGSDEIAVLLIVLKQ